MESWPSKQSQNMNYYLAIVLVFSLLSVALGATTLTRDARLRPTNSRDRALGLYGGQAQQSGGSSPTPSYVVAYMNTEIKRSKRRQIQGPLGSVQTTRSQPPTAGDGAKEENDSDSEGFTSCDESDDGGSNSVGAKKAPCGKLRFNIVPGQTAVITTTLHFSAPRQHQRHKHVPKPHKTEWSPWIATQPAPQLRG